LSLFFCSTFCISFITNLINSEKRIWGRENETEGGRERTKVEDGERVRSRGLTSVKMLARALTKWRQAGGGGKLGGDDKIRETIAAPIIVIPMGEGVFQG
jgi:hypothetical protein